MICARLYNDLASITFELYESKDERLPYALSVISIFDKGMIVFSSVEKIGSKMQVKTYVDWSTEYPGIRELLCCSSLKYEPFVAMCTLPDTAQTYDEKFFKSILSINRMELVQLWPIFEGHVYMVLYKEANLSINNLPTLMHSAYENTIIPWRDFFRNGIDKSPPRIDVNEIIESLNEFKGMAPYFETVTKISSLFYEKARCKGSIAVMMETTDNPLVQFKTNTDIEGLRFTVEYSKQLRKLLETTRYGLSLLVDGRIVYGIGEPAPIKSKYVFNITGHLEWNVTDHVENHKGVQVLRYKHGNYYLHDAEEIRMWYVRSKINDPTVLRTVESLLDEKHMKAYEQGALLIITDQAVTEVERLCERKRGLQTKRINLASKFSKANALCTIDGSLFLDKSGDCHGIGIILDGEAIVDGTPARGSRYNSTKTYISRCVSNGIEAYALILSSDGYLDIITSKDEDFLHLIKPAAEGTCHE
jgi:hypothetical protein